MPPATYARLSRFYAAAEGDPLSASGAWIRLLYFSAVTITTLGFGDITPVSDQARLWVTLEAIVGVAVIGLFLNALAHRIVSGEVAEASKTPMGTPGAT